MATPQQDEFLPNAYAINLNTMNVHGGPMLHRGQIVETRQVPVGFLRMVIELQNRACNMERELARLEAAQQPHPLDQALATLAQAWQAATVAAQPAPGLTMDDLLLAERQFGWDRYSENIPECPFGIVGTVETTRREGWLMARNGEARP